MESLILTGLVFLSIFTPTPVQSTTTPLVAIEQPPPLATSPTITFSTIKQRIHYYANLYGVSEITMNIAVKCESRYNPKANGDGGHSHGLVQIYAPAHPNITHTQMHDIDFSLDFLAKNLKEGHKNMWTCLRNN